MTIVQYAGPLTTPKGSGNYDGAVLLPAGTTFPPGASTLPAGSLPLGMGTMWFNDGTSYNGFWSNGTFNGTGTRRTSTFEYTGEYSNGHITGQGTMIYRKSGEYTGWFHNKNREGQGKMMWASGHTYDGQWKNDEVDGFGKMTWPNGDWWESRWNGTLKETFNGKGQLGPGRARWHSKTHPEIVYVGDTKDGLRHGVGTLTKPEHKYEGNFSHGRLHGKIKVTKLTTKKVTYRHYHKGDLVDD